MIDTIKIDDREFRKAMAVYAAGSKRSTAELLRQQAKLFLQDTVNVTPPAGKGARGSAAKQRGMTCVEKDILKLMTPYDPPAQANVLRAAGMFVEEASQKSPADIHKANRSKKDGRVPPGCQHADHFLLFGDVVFQIGRFDFDPGKDPALHAAVFFAAVRFVDVGRRFL